MNPLNNKWKTSRSNFCGRKFIGRRNCPDAAGKINDLWLHEQ